MPPPVPGQPNGVTLVALRGVRCRDSESSVDDLGTERGVVSGRAVATLRSVETQPLAWGIRPVRWTHSPPRKRFVSRRLSKFSEEKSFSVEAAAASSRPIGRECAAVEKRYTRTLSVVCRFVVVLMLYIFLFFKVLIFSSPLERRGIGKN